MITQYDIFMSIKSIDILYVRKKTIKIKMYYNNKHSYYKSRKK